tara:strand:+ start:53 stop:1063 length:1011 start_codon:yes stop_codon:yes gene_type:complete
MSFGGGDDPSNTSFQTQFQRDAPQIEARKLGLMDVAKEYTMFGQNPWEAIAPTAKPGEEGYGEYGYKGTDGRYDVDTKFGDLTRAQRMQEGQIDIPTQRIAGFDPLQEQAFQMAQPGEEGIGGYKPYLQDAQTFGMAATQQYDPSSYKAYMNPFQDEVISAVEDQFTKARNEATARAGSSAFGERADVNLAELSAQQAKTVGQLQAQNYGQAQQAAIGQFQNQMGRYGDAARTMAGLGGQAQQQAMSDIGGLMSAGSVQQQRRQQQLDASLQQQMQQLYEPYQRLGFTSDIYQGNIPSSAMATAMGTAPGSNPLAQTVGAGISGLAAYQGYKNITG